MIWLGIDQFSMIHPSIPCGDHISVPRNVLQKPQRIVLQGYVEKQFKIIKHGGISARIYNLLKQLREV